MPLSRSARTRTGGVLEARQWTQGAADTVAKPTDRDARKIVSDEASCWKAVRRCLQVVARGKGISVPTLSHTSGILFSDSSIWDFYSQIEATTPFSGSGFESGAGHLRRGLAGFGSPCFHGCQCVHQARHQQTFAGTPSSPRCTST